MPLLSKDNKPDRVTAFMSVRHKHVPVLHVRLAKPEDNDDLVPLFNAQSDHLRSTYGEFYIAELIEAQDEDMKCLVVECDKKAVGFMSVTANLDLDSLDNAFHLEPFNSLRKIPPNTPLPGAKKTPKVSAANKSKDTGDVLQEEEALETTEKNTDESSEKKDNQVEEKPVADKPPATQVAENESKTTVPDQELDQELREENDGYEEGEQEEEDEKAESPTSKGPPNAICIQLFCIDEAYETRSADFFPKLFELFPGIEFVAIAVPHRTPEFPLLKYFVRVPPKPLAVVPQQLYVFSKYGMLRYHFYLYLFSIHIDIIK